MEPKFNWDTYVVWDTMVRSIQLAIRDHHKKCIICHTDLRDLSGVRQLAYHMAQQECLKKEETIAWYLGRQLISELQLALLIEGMQEAY